MTTRRKQLLTVAVLIAVSTVLVYLLLAQIYQLPVSASAEAQSIDTMFTAHFIIIAFLFSLVAVFVLYSVFRFRRQEGDDADGTHFHGNTTLEILWTIVPLVMVVAFGVWGAFVLNDITEARPNEMVVNVTGQRFVWSFEYPDYPDVGPTQELVLPVDQPVRLRMNSIDVLHSFWVPEFRVKQDLVPGQETNLLVTPSETGDYQVRCAEICGGGHHSMRAPVQVVSQSEFDQWVQEQTVSLANLSPAERGEQWYTEFGCNGCHSVDGSDGVGPTWLGLLGRQEQFDDGSTATADEAYIRESILMPNAKVVSGYPQGVMPGDYEERFAARESELAEQGIEVDILAELIAYIQTLEE
ncbi:MAG: cytochrome c oxidase subunit II [Candidatus Promineifilaceae bacterium]|nr:cytochrome c oxidase subunit II [Candidatus Promineifilaceae bacterium]